MSMARVPERLQQEILGDLQPKRPLRHPAIRALEVATWAIALFLFVPALLPLRHDAPDLGWALVWGAAVGEGVAGLLLVALALAEAIPGGGIGAARALGVLGAGVAVQLAVGSLTWIRQPLAAAAEAARHGGLTCITAETLLALPGIGLALWLIVRALPVRPRWAGALAGMGAGLVADGVWHLVCPRSDPAHLLVWHFGATVLMAGAGWVMGALWEQRQARRLSIDHGLV